MNFRGLLMEIVTQGDDCKLCTDTSPSMNKRANEGSNEISNKQIIQ